MSFLNKFFIKLFTKKLSEDQFGNTYYESKKTDIFGAKKRYVIYKGLVEPSKVPPIWHAWLHYLSDELPQNKATNFVWQKDHIPNLTGTKLAYNPAANYNYTKKTSFTYSSWNPK